MAGDPSSHEPGPKTARVLTSRPPRRPGGLSALPFVVLAIVVFLITWFAFAVITGVPVGLGPAPSSSSSSGPAVTPVTLAIDNPFDTENNSTADQYAPANFSVPSHTLLEFTIVNYDVGQNPVRPPENAVSGTVGDCIYLNVTSAGDLGSCVKSIPAGFVAHTFSFVGAPYAGFNVPVPSANDSAPGGIGASVTFFAYFNTTGTFTWNCLAPCDPWSMVTDGFMTGTMTVR